MIVWLKAAHIASLAVWCAGLIAIPSLFALRGRLAEDDDRFALQATTRMLFISVASPAAFLAVGTGTALIFVRPVLEPWFVLKLLLVGGLASLHVWQGLVLLQIFLPEGRYRAWRGVVATSGTTLLVTAILWVVLEKPGISLSPVADHDLMQPGRLGEVIQSAYRRWRS